ncbi:allergen Asp F7 [Talaromyces stipitatus ATCC 10500]|uniref:Allergen Asp F7 n=1 Tax=Talaromyces stipitatus (strain ATCC 10500 / CBS 375.48 / QM 6759 / NRRL 1006) TaxID=441959 RepID=B8LTU0_TALSN|nr:allergen Asp F7 [Talaromyces stipitatus ATCC 10500]EED23682.1 allergen Asp F7 [Talaromyces stipitatus ATCC 10500]
MVFSKAFALAAIFATLTAAAPVNQRRAVVYETVTEVDVTTIDTTITVFPGEPTPAVAAAVYTTEAVVTSTTPAAVPTSTVAPSPAPVAETTTTPTQAPPAPPTTTTSTTPTQSPSPPPVQEAAAPPTTTTAAPVPTTTVAPPAPTTTSTPPAPTTTSTPPAPASTAPAGSSSGSGLSGTGDGTYYDTATSLAAPSYCGTANDGSTENVVALSHAIMDQSLCGAKITVSYKGNTATGIVVDKCAGCDAKSIDMSRAMFGDLASFDAGRITVSWSI